MKENHYFKEINGKNLDIQFGENARNTFHIIGKNIQQIRTSFYLMFSRGKHLCTEQYQILESIRDGCATSPKYDGQNLCFKQPHIFMISCDERVGIPQIPTPTIFFNFKVNSDLQPFTKIIKCNCVISVRPSFHFLLLSTW